MSLLSQAVVLLSAAVIAVPLLKRLGMSSVMGYLAAGVVIGPWCLGLVDQPDEILHTAELGVVLLLFIIGLELQPSRLWVLRRRVFGLGGAQVLLTTAAISAIALTLGLAPLTALLVALALSMSSTALVLQMLAEKKQLTSRYGRDGFTVLLFQDLAVIPLLALIPLLATANTAAIRPAAWISILALVAVLFAGRPLLRYLLRGVAKTDSHELLVMATLLIVLAMSLGMEAAGLSLSLGAFLAGVLLADSEYRHELEANIEPFKGVLLGLFFVAVGMSANLGLLRSQALLIIALACALIAVKACVLLIIGRLSGIDNSSARRLAIYLSQGGEFAFVLLALIAGHGLMPAELRDLLALVVTLSMALTPLLLSAHDRWIAPQCDRAPQADFDTIEPQANRVIIAGFGRVGQVITRVMRLKKISVTVLEINFEQVDFVRRFGNRIYYGDASRLDLLRAAGADQAELFVLAIDDVSASLKTAELVRKHFPHLKIYARARNRFHYYRLKDLGVTLIMRETFASSVELAGSALQGLGFSTSDAEHTTQMFRNYDSQLIERQYAVNQDEAMLIQTARDALQEVEALFEVDNQEQQHNLTK